MTDAPFPSSPEPTTGPAASSAASGRNRSQVIGDGVAWTALWSARWILIALGAVGLGLLVGEIWSILLPVALPLLVAAVHEPPKRLLERRLHLPAVLAAAIVVIGTVLALIGVGFALAPTVAGQSAEIVSSANGGLQKLQEYVQGQNFISRDQIDQLLQAVQDRLSSSGAAIAAGVISGVSAATSALVTLVVTLILTFLFLKDGRRFRPLVRQVAGEGVGGHLSEVLLRSWNTLGGFIRTQALVGLIDGVLIGTGLLIVGVPLAIPLALLTLFGAFVPIVGAFVAGGIAVLVALVSNGPASALIIFAVVLAVQQLEGNVLLPFLQGKSMQLHSAVVLLSITLGSTLFGIAGAFLAVPLVAVVAVVIRYLGEQVDARTAPAVVAAAPEPAADPEPGDDLGTGS